MSGRKITWIVSILVLAAMILPARAGSNPCTGGHRSPGRIPGAGRHGSARSYRCPGCRPNLGHPGCERHD